MKKLYFLITLFSTGYFFGQTNYFVENFDYPSGVLLDANGWYIHSGISSSTGLPINPTTVNNGGLAWASYIGSNVGNAALVNNTGVDVNKPLAGNISDGSVYASFLFKPSAALASTSTSNYFFHFFKYANETTPVYTAPNTASYRAKIFVLRGTAPVTQFKLGLNFNGSDFISPSNVTADLDITKTYLVVVKYTFVDGPLNDSVSLFVFEEGMDISTEPTNPTLGPFTATATSSTDSTLAPDIATIQGVALRQNNLGQNAIVDGIYIRKVWDLTNPGTALGVDKFAQNNTLKVYPNPVQNNRVSIYSSIEGEKEISLFDLNGRVVLKKTMTNNELDLTNVNKGVYMLQTKVGSSTSTTKLIVN